jgi:phi13 family phage major tail protein
LTTFERKRSKKQNQEDKTMEYFEYRGVSGLVCAEVLVDNESSFQTGEVFPLAGVAEIGKSSSSTSEAHYYDNIPAIIVVTDGVDTITINASGLELAVKAKITGQKYDATKGMLVEGPRKIKYFAIGYKTQATNGDEYYVWRLKGTFNVPDENSKTKDDSTDASGQELIYTGIKTTHVFENGGEDGPAQASSVIINTALDLIANKDQFFNSVQTPDTVEAKTQTPSVSIVPSRAVIDEGESVTLQAIVVPAGTAVSWSSSASTYATVANGVVHGEAAGSATITASITVGTDTFTDTCAVTVEAIEA